MERHHHQDPASVDIQSNFSARFAALSNPNHTIKNRFKLYYTARELTNHVAELFPLRSLDGEIIAAPSVTAEAAASLERSETFPSKTCVCGLKTVSF